MAMRAVINGFGPRDGHNACGMSAPLVTRRECPARIGHDLMHGVFKFRFLNQREIGVLRKILQIAMPVLTNSLSDVPANDVNMRSIKRMVRHRAYNLLKVKKYIAELRFLS